MRRLLTLIIAALGLLLLGAVPAQAAAKNAGMAELTPDGGYLGNYLAPDGFRVYCIDSPLPWPSGETSGPSTVDSLETTWGSALTAGALRRLNYVLLSYGQTDDPVRAAAVAAFVNAYTSGWARDLGAGYAAGAWYLNGNAEVTAVYDAIWADAEAHADPTGSAVLRIELTAPTEGMLTVAASPAEATGSVSLTGAVRADTGESTFAVTASELIPIHGLPPDDAREYAVSAEAAFSAPVTAGPALVLYSTAGQQRTIRGASPGTLEFAASAHTEAIPLDFAPVIVTAVESGTTQVGAPLVDRVTVSVSGPRPWRTRADGTAVPIVADGVLYGPFRDAPRESGTVPDGAPVAARETLTLAGPGEYPTSGAAVGHQPGYYTWVWTIDATRQDPAGAAALPTGYLAVTPFGLPGETHLVHAPPGRLAATGSGTLETGLAALALLAGGCALCLGSRVRGGGRVRGIPRTSPRWS